ncbi:MAG: dockerin type I repeat-containing protein [Phycisphaerae bacterium]
MGAKRRRRVAVTVVTVLACGLVVGNARSGTGAPPDPAGPVGRTTPTLVPPGRHQGADATSAWRSPPGGSAFRGPSFLLYDNGQPLNDFGDPASQLSLAVDGAAGVWRFVAATADDFVLVDTVSPSTAFQITQIRAGFAFFQSGAGTAQPSITWTDGVYVAVYGNSALDQPDGVPAFDPFNPAGGGGFTGQVVASQLVPAASLTETLVDTGCRTYWQVDMPVNFVLAKNTRYWLSITPKYAAPPQTAWVLSDLNSGFAAQRGSTFDLAFWTQIEGNVQFLQCTDPTPPPAGTMLDVAFQIYGDELSSSSIACCDPATGTCRNITAPSNCLANETQYVGTVCQFVQCNVVTGACCDDSTGICTESVNIAACAGMRFEENGTCAALNPPCGTTALGACCQPGGGCFELNPTDCSILGGSWSAGNCATFQCPPNNDDCAIAPQFITDGVHPFSTVGATTDGPAGGVCGDVQNDVWFKYFSTCGGTLTISLCLETDFDSILEVYQPDNICPTDFTGLVACDDDGCGPAGGPSTLAIPTVPGVGYLIRVGGLNGATGSGKLLVGCVPTGMGACCSTTGSCTLTLPGNCTDTFFQDQPCSPITCPSANTDDCANALAISAGTIAFDTTGATTDGPADSPGGICTDVNQDIWFTYVAECDGLLDVTLCGATAFDSALAVYDGCTCPPAGGPIACDNDGCGPAGASEIRNLPVVQGNCYLIRVGGALAAVGAGSMTVTCTPAAACCLGDVSGDSLVDTGDLVPMVAALLNPPAPAAPAFCAADANQDSAVDGLDVAPFVNLLLTGAVCAAPVTGACCFGDGTCTELSQQDCFNAVGVYQGNDTLCTPNPCPQPPQPPPNDECATAIMLSSNTQIVFNNLLATTNAVDDPPFGCHFGGAAQGVGTLWFTFIATDTDALVSTCATVPPVTDTLLAVYDAAGCPVTAQDEIACSEDAGGTCQRKSEVCATGLIPGNVYTIQVASFDAASQGDITLDLASPCPRGACCFSDGTCSEMRSDECLAAGGAFQGDGTLCTPNPCPPPLAIQCCVGDTNEDGVVDTLDTASFVAALLNPPALGTTAFCHADIDGDNEVDGGDVAGFVPLMLNPAPCPVPGNDDCANALSISCDTVIVLDNTLATTDPGDPAYSCRAGGPAQGAGTLWFEFVATDTSAFISTCDFFLPLVDTIVAVYDVSCPTAVDEIACNEDAGGACGRSSQMCVTGLTIGNTYTIQVSSFDAGALGFIPLKVTCPCP